MDENKPNGCYVCGIDLNQYYKADMSKQDGLNSPPVILQLIKWNGNREPVCGDCYKACVEGLKVFMEKNPNWQPPK